MADENISRLSIIAERYAMALVQIAEEENRLDQIGNELDTIENTFSSIPDLKVFLAHPKIPLQEKREFFDIIFKKAISKVVINFLKLLLDKNRLIAFSSINRAYKKVLAEKRKFLTANITTAVEIDKDLKEKLRKKLESLYDKSIHFNYSVDSKIIAGMIVEVDNKIIDGSVKTKLENMKKQIV